MITGFLMSNLPAGRMAPRRRRWAELLTSGCSLYPSAQPIVATSWTRRHQLSNKYFSPVGSMCTPLNKSPGLTHNSRQLSMVQLLVPPVGCLPLAEAHQFREVLRTSRTQSGS